MIDEIHLMQFRYSMIAIKDCSIKLYAYMAMFRLKHMQGKYQ